MTSKPAWDDVAVGIGTMLFAALVGWQTSLISANAIYAKVGPAAIPWVVVWMLAACGAALAVLAFLGRTGSGEAVEHGAFDRPAPLGCCSACC